MVHLASVPILNSDDPAPPHHLSDWGAWAFVGAIAATVVLWLIAAGALRVVDEMAYGGYQYGYSSRRDGDGWKMAVAVAVSLVATFGAAALHWWVARHFDVFNVVWLLFAIAPPTLLAWFASKLNKERPRRYGYGLAATATALGIIDVGNDSLSRLASSIPIGLTTLIAVIIIGLIAIGVFSATSSSSR